MRSRFPILAVLCMLTIVAAACGAPAAPAPATSMPPTAMPPATQAPASSGGSAATQAVPNTGAVQVALAQNSKYGAILADSSGMILYLYTKDTPNTSNCYGGCAKAWPPLVVTSGSATVATGLDASKLGTTTRTDGSTQVTYNGWPLYYFAKDKQAGDTNGQNVGSVWFVVTASGDAVK